MHFERAKSSENASANEMSFGSRLSILFSFGALPMLDSWEGLCYS